MEPSAAGVASMYGDICSNIVIDTKDRKLSGRIGEMGMNVYDAKILMKTKASESALASFILKQVRV